MAHLKRNIAVKHDEELSKIEAELVAQVGEVEEAPVVQTPEDTVVEESAPAEEKPTEEETSEPEQEATVTEEDNLTEEEQKHLSEKTRVQMSKLRDKAREAESLRLELDNLKRKEEMRKPLQEVEEEYTQIKSETPENSLPWERKSLSQEDVRRLSREEVTREKKLSLISSDADELEKIPELNPSSKEYNSELAEDIYSTFRDRFLKDDNTRLFHIAEKKLSLLQRERERVKLAMEGEKNVEKQVAEQAIPVNITPVKSKTTVTDMVNSAKSIKELEALEKTIGVSNR